MIFVYLEGHDFNYEVTELIKLFYFNTQVKFVEDRALVDDQSLLIENKLFTNSNNYYIETKVYKGTECISDNKIKRIENTDIKSSSVRKVTKLSIKQSIFEALSNISSVKVPWGVLTGIRPTKIVHDLINRHVETEEIMQILLTQYKLSKEKAKLLTDIAQIERKVIKQDSINKYSLYVSIPFCPTRCLYCSFPSNSIEKYGNEMDNYTDKLIYEIERTADLLSNKCIDTVYIGGGTPTALSVNNLDKIIKKIYNEFGTDTISEFTVEAGRPDTIDQKMLMMLRDNNIKRISINPQTMCEDTLKTIGRNHTTADINRAYNLARTLGFETINMDIIVGLPGENCDDVMETMKQIKKLDPDNLTVHTMAIKRASKLKENLEDYSLSEQQNIERMLSITRDYSDKMNMHSYYLYRQKQILGNFENVGYSKPNKECKYNILIMEEMQTIVAVGAGGISKFYFPEEDRIERVANVKNLYEYIKRVDEMINKKEKFI